MTTTDLHQAAEAVPMTGYLGMTRRVAVAVGAAAIAVGAMIGNALPTPEPAPCGYVVEGAEVVPAACSTAAELDARMTDLRAARTGGRFTEVTR
jgi:hypothetical protein